jgi:hypothetical protein
MYLILRNWNFEIPLKISGVKKFGNLSKFFNKMLDGSFGKLYSELFRFGNFEFSLKRSKICLSPPG